MLLRVRLADGRVLTARSRDGGPSTSGGGDGSGNRDSTITLGRCDVAGARKSSTASRKACVLTAARPKPTVEAVGSAPVVIHRAKRQLVVRPGGAAKALEDGDALQLCQSSEGDEDDERRSRVVVEVVEDEEATTRRGGEQPPQLLLVLVGLPGSGKTTLAQAILSHASADSDDDSDDSDDEKRKKKKKRTERKLPRQKTRPWVRVNADALGETRDWCVEAARKALARGRNVVVDRCNLSRADRAAFLSLARERRGVTPHLVTLDVPTQRCVERSYFRRHEASVQGGDAPAVVVRMSTSFEKPVDGEGFDSLEVIRSDLESDAAAERWGRSGVPSSRAAEAAKGTKKRSAFDELMSSPAREGGASPPPPRKKASVLAFLNGLLQISKSPEAGFGVSRVTTAGGRKLLVVPDKYPKARTHFLVLQETTGGRESEVVGSPRDLGGREHAELVREMLETARRRASESDGASDFRFGFHSEPSLAPLHLHAISQDLCGTAMARKKHYNSFKSPFFVDAERVIEALSRGASGASALLSPSAASAALAAPLACHRCGAPAANMLVLRRHLEEHERGKG